MRIRFVFLIVLAFHYYACFAQVSTVPSMPVASGKVTITFDSSKEIRLGYYTGELYAHTGVIIEGNSSWKHVIGSWGNNSVQPRLTYRGNGLYELEISPDINSFYAVTAGEKVVKLAFVFRSADGSKQTNDLFVDVFAEGLVISLSSPADNAIFAKNSPVNITAVASSEASLKLWSDGSLLSETTGKSISNDHLFTEGGWKQIVAEASASGKTVYDTAKIYVRQPAVSQPLPVNARKGINYNSNTSATLVLWAPGKEFVFLLGDFNNWQISDNYQMKKDGDYFWIDLMGLESGKAYIFQYLIDGNIRIADPYTEQTSDPNDLYISSSTYPGLPAYPAGKADGVASVLQTGQQPFSWEIESFTPPATDKLVIYETLIRDFTTEHTYLSVIAKLDYLKNLGINVLELMPVNEFEGNSSWGYNPSFYFATDKYYGPAKDLKKLVDEAHKRGMAVVIDMVLNHSYGQSPFVKMYWDKAGSRPSADNPWYNTVSNFQNPSAQWGYDFNHESTYTRQLVDSINSFWMKEYKIDGFRFDFTKGFSNTVYGPTDWGSAYDIPRIYNLKRMATEIWKRNPDAFVIFEHLAGNTEEMELSDAGIMLWGNMNGNYSEGAMGYNESGKSNLTWGIYSNRSWTKPSLVTYMESHDEERVVYKCLQYGKTEGSYSVKDLNTALTRAALGAVFFLPLQGPKMIWQFGELGYDYSINTCENSSQVSDNCRLSPKPVKWNYVDMAERKELYQVMGRLNYLKTNYDEFSASSSYSGSLYGETKWYTLSNNGNHVVVAGNFATSLKAMTVEFPVTGTWYDYFNGTSLNITEKSQEITLNPGGYKFYTTRKMNDPFAGTGTSLIKYPTGKFTLYPNPTRNTVFIRSDFPLKRVSIMGVTGQEVFSGDFDGDNQVEISLKSLPPGMYMVKPESGTGVVPQKLIIF